MPHSYGDAVVGGLRTLAGCQAHRRRDADCRRAHRETDEISSRHGLRIHRHSPPMLWNCRENTGHDRPKEHAAGCRPTFRRRRRCRWPGAFWPQRRSCWMSPYSNSRSRALPPRPRTKRRAGFQAARASCCRVLAIGGGSSRRESDESSRPVTPCSFREISFALGRSDAHRIADQGPARIVARHGQVLARHIGAATRRPWGVARCQQGDRGDAGDHAEQRRSDGVSSREHCRICLVRRG